MYELAEWSNNVSEQRNDGGQDLRDPDGQGSRCKVIATTPGKNKEFLRGLGVDEGGLGLAVIRIAKMLTVCFCRIVLRLHQTSAGGNVNCTIKPEHTKNWRSDWIHGVCLIHATG